MPETGLLPLADHTLHSLDQAIEGLKNGLVVVCGFPASGKSTVARYLALRLDAVLFDKDGFAPALEQSVMRELTGNPHDRDSEIYRSVVGPNIYEALTCNALRVAQRARVVVDAPFLEFVSAATARMSSLSEFILAKAEAVVPVRSVWVAADPETIKNRMISRGAERDRPKLDDWATYRSTVLESGVAAEAEAVVDYFISN
ncbi:AAA family ATPase [Nocardia cyriacigeorgica]|uniref:AAA family ATPase n=1 Tax=Nocardia cyriacigeorgica TaxID=135487 RepID=UPI0024565860|nr:AAA family ATPase [Nocardia cyriacigeorgica]